MGKLKLDNVTLLGLESVESDIDKFKRAADICREYVDFGKVKLLTPWPEKLDDTDGVYIDRIISPEKYQQFCINEMNNYFDTDYVLTFQSDGFILNPDAWTDEFFNYDYIGAPWAHTVGNGGFSLRSKKLMNFVSDNIEIVHYKNLASSNITPQWLSSVYVMNSVPDVEGVVCNEWVKVFYSWCMNEDNLICQYNRPFLESRGFKFPTAPFAQDNFSVETNAPEDDITYTYKDSVQIWNGQFGFHGKYLNIKNWNDRERFNIYNYTLLEDWKNE
jgi:hypothetical protein